MGRDIGAWEEEDAGCLECGALKYRAGRTPGICDLCESVSYGAEELEPTEYSWLEPRWDTDI